MIDFVSDMWTDGWSGKFMLLVLTVGVALLALIPYAIYQDHKVGVDCRLDGGEMLVVGHHQQLIPMYVGKTMILMPQQVTDYECSVREEVHP